MNRLVPLALIAALPLITACDNGGTTTPPASPTVLTTETFMGTVPVLGSDFHNFTVSQTGTVSITLTAAGPPPTISMGLAVGTGGGATCVRATGGVIATPAGTTAQLSGTAGAGTLCVEVFDAGNQFVPVDYTVTVSHP